MVGSLLSELSLEGVERTPGLDDEVEKLAGGLASSVGGKRLPVEGVVPDLNKGNQQRSDICIAPAGVEGQKECGQVSRDFGPVRHDHHSW